MSNPYSQPDPGIAQQERDLERLSKPADTVYAHVERTVHALLANIERRLEDPVPAEDGAFRIKLLAEAAQALSSWPQFNPMNSHEQYKQLAEYEVERAVKTKLASLQRDLAAKAIEVDRNLQVTR